MPANPLNVVEFEGSLADLIRVVQKRVNRATELIGASDDSEIIDREMRFIRPFWDFLTARRAMNSTRYWTRIQAELLQQADSPFRKTPLMWVPCRTALCLAAQQLNERTKPQLINLLFGMDLVIFNFTRLLGRMKYSFGIDDPESFEIRTTETDLDRGYTFRNRCIVRHASDGATYRVLTSLFAQPNGEEIKIEKDYSCDLVDPQMELRVQQNSSSGGQRLPALQYAGRHSEMKHRCGVLRVR